MEELPSFLLPLLLLSMATEAVLGETGFAGDRFRKLPAIGLLLMSALAASVTGPLEFRGPTLFVLDSFHQIGFHLQADWLLLGILAVFVLLPLRSCPTNRLLPIAIVLFLLADNFGLQFLAGGWLFGLLVVGRVRKDAAVSIDAGLGLFALMFLLLSLGLLAFDLETDSWSELTRILQTNESWSAHEHSSLKLSSYFLMFSALILTGMAPFQSLWILSEHQEEKFQLGEVMRFLLAIGLLERSRGLLIWAATGSFAVSLTFVTFLLAAVCAPFQLGSHRVVRTLFVSHFALAMSGMLGMEDVAFVAGVCHALVACSVFVILLQNEYSQSKFTLEIISLILFGGLSGAYLLLNTVTQVGIGIELTGLLAWMSLALTQTHYARCNRISAVEPTENQPRVPAIVLLGVVPLVSWVSISRQIGMAAAFERVWLLPEVILAGVTGLAIGWFARCSRPSGEWLSDRIPCVARIFERQFYLKEFVLGTVRIPGAICLGVYGLVRDGVIRAVRFWEQFHHQRRVTEDESVRWELLRGFVCVAVLLIVFLWMGR